MTFTMLCSFYKSYNSSLYFILHTPLTQPGPRIQQHAGGYNIGKDSQSAVNIMLDVPLMVI